MEFRRAVEEDFRKIVDLQKRNLADNLSTEEKTRGFLSGYFEAQDLRRINDDMCVLVCVEGTVLAGFICLTTPEFNRNLGGMPGALMQNMDGQSYAGKSLADWAMCLCGPVCIEQDFRGQGLFAQLYQHIPQHVPNCELALTAVALSNETSLRAHRKVDLEFLFDFDSNGTKFRALARRINT